MGVVALLGMGLAGTVSGDGMDYTPSETFQEILNVCIFAVWWLYYALLEASSMQGTLGKMAVRMKVTDVHGNSISFGRASGRFFGKLLSVMTLYIGFLMAGWTSRKQASHDMVSGCLVMTK